MTTKLTVMDSFFSKRSIQVDSQQQRAIACACVRLITKGRVQIINPTFVGGIAREAKLRPSCRVARLVIMARSCSSWHSRQRKLLSIWLAFRLLKQRRKRSIWVSGVFLRRREQGEFHQLRKPLTASYKQLVFLHGTPSSTRTPNKAHLQSHTFADVTISSNLIGRTLANATLTMLEQNLSLFQRHRALVDAQLIMTLMTLATLMMRRSHQRYIVYQPLQTSGWCFTIIHVFTKLWWSKATCK